MSIVVREYYQFIIITKTFLLVLKRKLKIQKNKCANLYQHTRAQAHGHAHSHTIRPEQQYSLVIKRKLTRIK